MTLRGPEVFGAESLSVQSLDHGAVGIHMSRVAPLEMLLLNPDPQLLLGTRLAWGMLSESRALVGLPATREAVEWIAQQMLSDLSDTLGELLVRQARQDEVREPEQWRQLAHDAGAKLSSEADVLDCDPEAQLRMLRELAARHAEKSPMEEHEALWEMITGDSLFPVIKLEQVRKQLSKLHRVGQIEKDHALYAGPCQPKAPYTLDLLWPDLTRRMWIVHDGAGHWEVLLYRAAIPLMMEEMAEVVYERCEAHRFEDIPSLLRWTQALWQAEPSEQPRLDPVPEDPFYQFNAQLITANAAEAPDPLLGQLRISPTQTVLAQWRPSPEDHPEMNLLEEEAWEFAPGRNYAWDFHYDGAVLLRQRLSEWGQSPGSSTDSQQLRQLIGKRAAAHNPLRSLPWQAGFVRRTRWPDDPEGAPLQQPDLQELEALTCRKSPRGFVHAQIEGQPTRLREQLRSLELYHPLNPFADG